jgi:hypothetical protein
MNQTWLAFNGFEVMVDIADLATTVLRGERA